MCGCLSESLGITREVLAFKQAYGKCWHCGLIDAGPHLFAELSGWCPDGRIRWYIEPYRLRRIPPLSELEGLTTQEPVRESKGVDMVDYARKLLGQP